MTPERADDAELSGLDLFFDGPALPALLIDLDRRQILRVNQAVLGLLGLPEGDVVGRTGRDFFTEVPEEQLARARALGGERTTVIREVRTATGPRIVEMHMTPTGVGDIAFVQAVDLTDALAAERSSTAQVAELQRTSDLLSTLGQRLAHDLRSPLTVIAGFVSLLRENHELTVEQTEGMLARIETNAHSLASLVEVILQDAQVHVDDVEVSSTEAADLLDVVRGATAAQIAEAGGVLEVDAEIERLPVPVGTLLQPLLNLVSNAIKYRSPDRVLLVEVIVRTVPGGIEITVSDNGRGLGEDPAALFDAGARGTSADGTVGSGLGLSFVQATMEAIGGTVTACERPGGGARFELFVPDRIDDPAGAALAAAEQARVETSLQQILDASPIPSVVIDLERREIVRASDAMVALLGLPRNRVIGQPGRNFLDDQAVGDALRDAAMAMPGSFTSSVVGLRTITAILPVRIWLASVPDSVFAVAQLLPESVGPDEVAGSDIATVVTAMASAARARAGDVGVAGLVDALERIEQLVRSIR